MTHDKGTSLAETRRINRVLIKDAILRHENITRNEIARLLELTLPTISTSIQEMINEGFVEEYPVDPMRKATAGRKPTAVAFRADAAYSVGVELGPYDTSIVLMDMQGNIREERRFPAAPAKYEDMLAELSQNIRLMLPAGKAILGIGIGVSGFVENGSGRIRSNRNKDWNGKRPAEDLMQYLPYPALADNNIRLRALGYQLANKSESFDTFAYFFAAKGVACPLMIRNELLSGSASCAGELGQNVIRVAAAGTLQQSFQTVDELCSESAILRKCNALIRAGALEADGEPLHQELTGIWEVLDLQRRRLPALQHIMEEAVTYLGIALSQVVNIINPGLVVLDAAIFCNEENRALFERVARRHFCALNEEEVRMRFLPFEKNRGAAGAAYLIIKKLLVEADRFQPTVSGSS